jgi:hypothetical protein
MMVMSHTYRRLSSGGHQDPTQRFQASWPASFTAWPTPMAAVTAAESRSDADPPDTARSFQVEAVNMSASTIAKALFTA